MTAAVPMAIEANNWCGQHSTNNLLKKPKNVFIYIAFLFLVFDWKQLYMIIFNLIVNEWESQYDFRLVSKKNCRQQVIVATILYTWTNQKNCVVCVCVPYLCVVGTLWSFSEISQYSWNRSLGNERRMYVYRHTY